MTPINGGCDIGQRIRKTGPIFLQENIRMNHKKFYVELGKMLYAVANADGRVQPQEISALHESIENQFVAAEAESDEFGVNDAYYAEFEFETLKERNASVEQSFRSFIDYLRKNRKAIDGNMKKACISAAEAIARTHPESDSMEAKYLERLKEELEKI